VSITGVIGVPSGEFGRYRVCDASLLGLQTPPGTARLPVFGANIAENRNIISEQAVKLGAEWVLYVDDDQVLAPDTLMRLLARDKDIVSGIYLKREMPFVPQMYAQEDQRGWCYPRLLAPFASGLVEVVATGAGCLLVKTKVLEAMEKPHWRLGQITSDGWGDDMNFCHRAREAGFKVWCDLDTRVGHQINGTIWPVRREDGSWDTVLIQGKDAIAQWPAAQERSSSLIEFPKDRIV